MRLSRDDENFGDSVSIETQRTILQKLNADLAAQQQSAVDAEKWVNLIKQYVNPSELTAELLNALIEKIIVHEAVKDESNTRTQEIEIYYRFIGKVE